MEPVPETERMEEFKPSPVPSLRLGNCSSNAIPALELDLVRKPPTLRRSTDPSPSFPSTPASAWAPPTVASIPYRPRTASPLSGSHARSRSVASLALSMSRTQSMPGVSGSGRILYSPQLRPTSPLGSPSRVRAPRRPVDEAFPASLTFRASVLDAERRPAAAPAAERSASPARGSSMPSSAGRLRRPSSPLRSISHSGAGSLSLPPSTPSSNSSTSSLRVYDAFAVPHVGSLSSIPSTPTSARSRSPSISSLETIPDSPDAEEAALEAERLAALQAATDAGDAGDSSDVKGRSMTDVPTRGRTMSFGPRDKRKRWSVCGAERRGDLDLETIWED